MTVHPTEASYEEFVDRKQTDLRINVTAAPKKVVLKAGKKKLTLKPVDSPEALENTPHHCYYYDEKPNMNRFATPGSEFAKTEVRMGDIDKNFCVAFIRWLQSEYKTTWGNPLSPKSMSDYVGYFSTALNAAVRADIIPENPFMSLTPTERM